MANSVKYYTHVNRGVIDSNRKNGTNNPPIAVKRGKTPLEQMREERDEWKELYEDLRRVYQLELWKKGKVTY